jgi:hypothetical protein
MLWLRQGTVRERRGKGTSAVGSRFHKIGEDLALVLVNCRASEIELIIITSFKSPVNQDTDADPTIVITLHLDRDNIRKFAYRSENQFVFCVDRTLEKHTNELCVPRH